LISGLALGLFCVFVGPVVTKADHPIRFHQAKEMRGVWVGYDEACLYFYRLQLGDRGKGSLVARFAGESTELYNVRWGLTNDCLRIELSPANERSEEIQLLPSHFDLQRIQLTVKGAEWERTAVLYNERDLTGSMKITRRVARDIKR
jgi:hypothetical protein